MIKGIQINKEFGLPAQKVLNNINLTIEDGEFVSISGRSGSGKSTLLYILSTLDHPSSGEVIMDSKKINEMTSDELHLFRNKNIGFIFQFHYLLPELTALENVLLPARSLNILDEKKQKALQLLEELEVLEQKDKLPSQMSGGQQQRVAIARALILQPKYIFADEPTGNLDTHNADKVMKILRQNCRDYGTTICLVTHEPSFSKQADREIRLSDGCIVEN